MQNSIQLEIVTPEQTIYSEPVEMVTLPGVDGQMTILPQHVRLITQLVPGELIVRKQSRDEFLAVGEGLVEVTNDRLSIVTNMAVALDSIDEAAAEEARQRAAARLKEKLSAEEIASVSASLTRSLAQLHVKRRHR
jgi:F-type H+-transporting ATPase subunit epsilon